MTDARNEKRKMIRTLLLGGLLPVVAFAFIEEYFGTFWGLVAGMILGFSEMGWEWFQNRRIDPITLGGNGMLIILGSISLLTQEGMWFKLQPAIMEWVMALILLGSSLVGKPLLVLMAKRQGTLNPFAAPLKVVFERNLGQMTFRVGIFFLLHAALATHAALFWSTRAWAILKGIGFFVTLILYMVIEMILLRYQMKRVLERHY